MIWNVFSYFMDGLVVEIPSSALKAETTCGVVVQRNPYIVGSTPTKIFLCGCNSVVECDLAKVEVEGSNPFTRSNLFPLLLEV